MKKWIASILCAAFLPPCAAIPTAAVFGVSAAVTLSAGCAHRPPAARRYLALSDTWAAVKSAMTAYARLAEAGKISPKDCDRVDAAYEKFRAALLVAIRAAQFDWSSPNTPELDALSSDLLNLIATLTDKRAL